jgi:hypothetical protein
MGSATDPARLREGVEKAERATTRPWFSSLVGATAGATIRRESDNRPVARIYPEDRDVLDEPGGEGAERARRAILDGRADGEYIVHAANDYPALARAHRDLLEAVRALVDSEDGAMTGPWCAVSAETYNRCADLLPDA